MNKKFETSIPISLYFSLIGLFILLIIQFYSLFMLEKVSWLNWTAIILISTALVFHLKITFLIPKHIELTQHNIKTEKIEIPIKHIDKIIIDGHFQRNIGIKQVGKKLVSSKLFFRFTTDEEMQISELKNWAEQNGITVVKGRIYRW